MEGQENETKQAVTTPAPAKVVVKRRAKSNKKVRKVVRTNKPASNDAEQVAAARARSDSPTDTLEQKIARIRRDRIPFGSPEKKWGCPLNDGYHYRVFNDNWAAKPGNIEAAQAAGYEFVESNNEKEKPKVVGTNENGTAIKGYLMRIPQEIYDEDQKVKQKVVDRIDEQISAGSLQQGAGDNRYIPAMGIKISSDNRPPEI
jgi:hypothetical protein